MPGPPKPMERPFKPHLAQEATAFFESLLTPESKVFEYGSGESTLWLAERVAEVVSVEHDPAWRAAVVDALAANGLDADVILAQDERAFPDVILAWDKYYFDVVFVDCLDRLRIPCVKAAMLELKPGGWFVLDDANWAKLNPARRMLSAWRCVEAKGKKRSWTGNKIIATRTDFYWRPN